MTVQDYWAAILGSANAVALDGLLVRHSVDEFLVGMMITGVALGKVVNR